MKIIRGIYCDEGDKEHANKIKKHTRQNTIIIIYQLNERLKHQINFKPSLLRMKDLLTKFFKNIDEFDTFEDHNACLRRA
jgi:hypothetical protein